MAAKQSWYEQVESERLPANEVHETNDGKITRIEYRVENDKIYKTTKTFEKRVCQVLPIVAERRKWKKFGDAAKDAPGINNSTTKIGDEVKNGIYLESRKQGDNDGDDDIIIEFLTTKHFIQCRRCKGAHLTAKCPHKDYLPEPTESLLVQAPITQQLDTRTTMSNNEKYTPPARRLCSAARMNESKQQDDTTIYVSNLPDETVEKDLQELFGTYGRITRIHCFQNDVDNRRKDSASITFTDRKSPLMAIDCINGFGYGNLILKVEWSRKRTNLNSN